MNYTVILPRSVQKQLAKLDATVLARIEDSLLTLQKTPRSAGAKKLKGAGWMESSRWRLPIRFYRSSIFRSDIVVMFIAIDF